MPKFKESTLYRRLEFVERFAPPIKRMHETIESLFSSIEYILFMTKELEPDVKHLNKNVEKLKGNIQIFEESLKRHGFEIEKKAE